MPIDWIDGERGRDTGPVAEAPDMDPMGDGDGEADDLLTSFDYRRTDRDSLFDGGP